MALMSSVRQATLLYRTLAAMSASLGSSKQYPLSQLLGFMAAPGHSNSAFQSSAAIMRQCSAVASMCTTSCEAPVHEISRLQAEASASAPSADSHDTPLHLRPAPQFRPFAPRYGLAQCLLSGATSQPWTSSSARGFATVARKRRKMPMSVRGRRIDAEPESSPAEALVSSEQHGVAEQSSEHLPAVDARPATDVQIADVVNRPALIVTRDIEWGTVILGFEQQNKYTVLDQNGEIVALLAEDGGGFGKQVGRQLLRTRRSFTATIFSPDGSLILRLRRPAYLINSTIYIENAYGEVIGEVKQRWHLWQRNYDVYLDRRQIAVINSPLLAWEFALKDETGGVLALIDRNFQGFGKELFTDAGKYVIHFGDKPEDAAEQVANAVQAAHPDKPRPDVTKIAQMRTDVAVIPTATGNQLEVARPLSVDERTLVLATAVSIDFDYFSQHSHGSGLGFMPWLMPIPTPSPSYPEDGDAGAPPADVSPGESSEAGAPGNGGTTLDSGEGGFPSDPSFGQESELDPPGQGSWDDNAGWEREEGGFGTGDDGGSEEGGGLFDLARDFFSED